MIATISQQDAATDLVATYLKTITKQGFTGDTDASYASRLTAATDNSIYQQIEIKGGVNTFSISAGEIQGATAVIFIRDDSGVWWREN